MIAVRLVDKLRTLGRLRRRPDINRNRLGLGVVMALIGLGMIAHDVLETARPATWQWSKTASSNSTADPTINWAEGMPPALVNDSARAMMARLAEFRDDTSGSLTTSGTSTAYTLTTNQGLPATPNSGQLVCFVPHVTNGATPTLAVDLGAATAIQTQPGVPVGASSLIQGTPYCASYNASQPAWVLFGAGNIPVPLGAMLDYTGAVAPTSNWALAAGQAISRTTYAAYFSLVGTTYGAGDGVTTFNIPDLRGRLAAGQDNMGGSAAGRIGTVSTDSGTIVGTTLGSAAGSATHAQTLAELATHNHSAADSGHTHSVAISTGTGNYSSGGDTPMQAGGSISTGTGFANVTIGNAGSGNAMSLLQPTMILTKIVRIQ
jgi:microcystin-dependent protein